MGLRNLAITRLTALVAVLALASTPLASSGTEWYPASVENWANKVNNANRVCLLGYKQSPVNLPGCNVSSRPNRSSINVTWANQSVTLENNGHTVQLTPKGSSTGQMSTNIAGVVKTYTLLQCHFHWGSEHVIDSVQPVMELHCVHKEENPAGEDMYGVLGIFYEVGAASMFLSQFEDELPTHEDALAGRLLSEEEQPEYDLLGNLVDQKSWRRLSGGKNTSSYTGPTNFLEAVTGLDMTQYWNYDGSFTTPPCTEIVDWYNLMGKATLSQVQLDKFKYAMGWSAAGGNFRNAQPLRGRTIYGCTALPQPVVMKPWYPYLADNWAAGSTNANQVCKHGTFQSPIDFEKCAVPSSRETLGITWPTQTVQLTNNGHTVQITAGNSGDARGKMVFGRRSYTLIQCHWHWGSEHRVGGLQLPLEVHCVHQLDGTSEAPSYGVFGVFYELSDKRNPFLARFEDQLPSAPAHRRLDEAAEKGQVHGLNLFGHPIINGSEGRRLASSTTSSFTGPLDMQALYAGVDKAKFWDYEGSFTTPPCTEAVDFYIMMGRAGMTVAQLNKFKAAIGWDTLQANGNFRPPQNLNGRAVSGCESINLPQSPVVAVPAIEEEPCSSPWQSIALQAITGVCVVVILLMVCILASKAYMRPGMAGKDGGNSLNQVYGKSGTEMSSGGTKDDVQAAIAKLQEDLKAVLPGNQENGKLVSDTVQLAKEMEEIMNRVSHPAGFARDVSAGSAVSAVSSIRITSV